MMEQNEKFLIGWTAYFFSRIDFMRSKTFECTNIPEMILNKKEKDLLLKQIKSKTNRNKRVTNYLKSRKEGYEITNILQETDFQVLLYRVFDVLSRIERQFVEQVLGLVKTTVSKYEKYIKIKCSYSDKVEELVRLFKLTECEKKILLLCYLKQTDSDFGVAIDDKEFRSNLFMSKALGTSVSEVILALSEQGNLRKYILQERTYDSLKLQNYILSFFSDYEKPNEFFYRECLDAPFDINTFAIKAKELETLLCLLKTNTSGLNILFHGEAGTGKTELAKSIAKATNKKIYFINDENDKYGVKKRLASIDACLNTVDISNSIIVVDEADSILNTSGSFFINGENVEKGFINKRLEQNPAKIIWITNNVNRIEPSALRRFAFSMQFKRMTKKQRILMWENVLKQKELTAFLDNSEIKELSEKYEVNTAGIALALNGVEPILQEQNKEEVKSKIEVILKNHKELIYGESKNHIKNNSINYSLDGLNMDTDPRHIVNILNSFKANKADGIRNMNLMLSGVPGTGKTEFARYLSRELDLDMITKTASELISCYVGNTEKNIRYAFEEAKDQGAMLFIDEADTFLYPRESAQRSWEISHTNEMLYQIESFEGVLICATNFYKNLDPASIRRFNIKVNFDYLNNDGKFLFYKKMLAGLIKNNDNTDEYFIKERLDTIQNLTPGDFKVVYQKNFYLHDIKHERLINDLGVESKNKSHLVCKKMGFAL